jgi:hypothetical protein
VQEVLPEHNKFSIQRTWMAETLDECLDCITLLTRAEFNGFKTIILKGDPHGYYTPDQKLLFISIKCFYDCPA